MAATLLVIAVWVGSAAVSAATHAQIRGTLARPLNQVISPQVQHQSYSIIDLGTLGGKSSTAIGINDRDWVTGVANLQGNDSQHAVLWTPKEKIDLGTLGGPNSAVSWPIKANTGAIAGISETSATDPLRENFCSFGTSHICLGFLWRNGAMLPLPTLGGNNSDATAVNDRGQVAGFAENHTRDPNCIAPQSLDFEGVIWGPSKGQMQVLPPLAGDAVAGAAAINDSGQAVGASGICQNPSPAAHAVLWQNNSVINLGSLGGKKGNIATAINNRGEIAGFSDLAGDDTSHAFLWRNGVMTDLGILPGDFSSAAFGINDKS
ncbi:MAG: hypothetical protein M3007_06350, partial [Candidatus Eremiobacteraeota bacterium]|nr:hypothetical protein [Candidatus Eremiobacteraeota bacterium]